MPFLSLLGRLLPRRALLTAAALLLAGLAAAPSAHALQFSEIAAGRTHTCAVLAGSGGQVYCWGSNRESQIGRLLVTVARTPTYTVGTYDAFDLAAGTDYTCAARRSGVYSCWGKNLQGQLGIPGRSIASTPDAQSAVPTPVSITAGDYTTCAIAADRSVWCWGDNYRRQVGVSPTTFQGIKAPVQVPGVADAVQVSVGSLHTCALLASGAVTCWGDTGFGKVGVGLPNAIQGAGLPVSGITDATRIAAGSQHTCAIRSGGTVWCWGSDQLGQLGDGDGDTTSAVPRQVRGIVGATDLSSRADSTCAVAGGEVYCWGTGDDGQLGNGKRAGAETPVKVSYLSGAAQVSVGTNHACALTTDGTAYCWGENNLGQLGNGDLPGPSAGQSTPNRVVQYVLGTANYLPAAQTVRPLGSRGGTVELRSWSLRLRSDVWQCPSRARLTLTADGKTRSRRVGGLQRNGDHCELTGSFALPEDTASATSVRVRVSGSGMRSRSSTLRALVG